MSLGFPWTSHVRACLLGEIEIEGEIRPELIFSKLSVDR